MQYLPLVGCFPQNNRFKPLAMWFLISTVNRSADIRIDNYPSEVAFDVDGWIAEFELRHAVPHARWYGNRRGVTDPR